MKNNKRRKKLTSHWYITNNWVFLIPYGNLSTYPVPIPITLELTGNRAEGAADQPRNNAR